jgi:D-3-phosphoglycerate dehydrogenase / 2-oxoglutarate reductase
MTEAAKRRVVACGARFEPLDIEEGVLGPLGLEVVKAAGDAEHELIEGCRGSEAILAGSAPRFPRSVLEGLRGVKVLVRYGIGVDRIDLEAASDAGILVCNVLGYCTDEVALQAVTLTLALTRKLEAAAGHVRTGGWGVAPFRPIAAPEATTVAVLGLGRIGRRAAAYLAGLGFRVTGYDPFVTADPTGGAVELRTTLESALRGAQVVTLHLPLSERTRHLLGERELRLLAPGAVVVNVSRGGLIDEAAMLRAIDEGRLGGAALDVVEDEPPTADNPLLSHPAVLVTPHMAWYSVQAEARMRRLAAEEVARVLQGEAPKSPVASPARR